MNLFNQTAEIRTVTGIGIAAYGPSRSYSAASRRPSELASEKKGVGELRLPPAQLSNNSK